MIPASSLNINDTNINSDIEQRIIQYNKSKIRKETEIFRNQRRIELADETYKLTKAEKEEIARKVIESDDTKKLKITLYNDIKKEKEDFIQLRSELYGFNKINKTNLQEYITIEKTNIYNFDKLPKYRDILLDSLKYRDIFVDMLNNKRELIAKSFDIEVPKHKLSERYLNDLKYKCFKMIIDMFDMYQINMDDYDDIELFEKYDYKTNIDFSIELSQMLKEILVIEKELNIRDTNFINEFFLDNHKSKNTPFTNVLENSDPSKILRFLSVLCDVDFISNNEVSSYNDMYANTETHTNIYATRTLGELLLEIINPNNANISKDKRKQIYLTYDGTRPLKDEYYRWNGLQIFDLDLKEWISSGGNIDELKQSIHILMCEFNWYLWICKSSSGNGLHIYTKVSPPYHVYTNLKQNNYISEYVYRINYITKRQVINEVLLNIHTRKNNNIKFNIADYGYPFDSEGKPTGMEFHNTYLDNVVGRITAGIRLSYDSNTLLNYNFVDLPVGLDLTRSAIYGLNIKNVDAIFDVKTTEKFYNRYVEQINNTLAFESYEEFLGKHKQEQERITNFENLKMNVEKLVDLTTDLDEIKVLPKNNINYFVRYNVCNTLAYLFGQEGLPLAHIILDSEGCKNQYEINSFYSCALSNRKEPSKLGLEILKQQGIIKNINTELTEETTKTFKGELKSAIEQAISTVQDNYNQYDYNLLDEQYLSHIQSDIERSVSGEFVNVIISPAGSGKTAFILNLAKQGKRIMLVLPYISIISNKVENDKDIREYFDVYYGNKDIRDIRPDRNIVTTFDKLSRSNYEKISRMFDYIMIDEEHLLYISSYRIDTTSNVIKKIKDLYYISNNNPFAAKIMLLTGTPVGHEQFFNKVAKTIRVSKRSNKKTMEFLMCDDSLDAITRLSIQATKLLQDGYRLMIPTNKGELYSEKLVGMITHLLGREVKYGYYKRSNIEQEICRLINEQTTIGDYEIVFCSNYLSVGVDINDRNIKFASLYLGNFSGYEIEQFNARIRKESIKSIYCIITEDSQGNIKDDLLKEPDLVLRLTDDDIQNFQDDKKIAGVKNEFLAEYDPVLRKITTPGFSVVNGKIDFVVEEYELLSFENKYNSTMEHPIKVARELCKYGYEITINTESDSLSKEQQEKLKKHGLESMFSEKQRKHNLLIGTYIDLIRNNNFTNENGLEYFNLIDWIGKNSDKIIEDRDLIGEDGKEIFIKPIYDLFATPVNVIVKSKEALDKMFKPAKYLIKKYSEEKAINIILQYVDEKGILKQKYFQRSINLLKLIDSSNANELSEPINNTLNRIYNFVDMFETDKNYRIGYQAYQSQLQLWVNEYIQDLGIKISTKYAFEKIQDAITEMINDIATRSTSKNGIRFSYNKLPQQDSNIILNRNSIDTLVSNMFNLTEIIVADKNRMKNNHIILEKQEF